MTWQEKFYKNEKTLSHIIAKIRSSSFEEHIFE